MFYLFAHAFFKALLFLGAGSIMHSTEQTEVEQMGGLAPKMPLTAVAFTIGALSMAGLVPLAGFWAKDDILLSVFDHQNIGVFILVAFSVLLTALYMARLIILVFTGEPRNRDAYEHAHEAPPSMAVPLVLLAGLTLIAGFVAFDGVGRLLGFPGGIGQFVFTEEAEVFHANGWVVATSTVLAVVGLAGGYYFWWGPAERARLVAERVPQVYRTLRNKYYMDDFYQAIIDRVVLAFSALVSWFDRNVVNDTGVDGTAETTRLTGYLLKFQQTGRMPNYALAIIVGVIALALIAFGVRG
jgi:NADH-quinone oxidoreductase subunit L